MYPIVTDRVAWSVGLSVTVVNTAKQLNRSRCRLETWVVPRKNVLGGVHIDATWRIPLNRPCAAAMDLLSNYFNHVFILFTDHFNGPARAMDPACVCGSVCGR